MNKKIISFVFLGLILGSSVQTECSFTFKKAAILTSALVAGLAIYRYNSKKTEKEPLSRFEIEKLKTFAINKNFKEFANQIWYFLDDVIVGQPYKADGIVADKEGKIEVKKGNPCSGLMGNIEKQIKPVSAALTAIVAVISFYNFDAILKKYYSITDALDSVCDC